MNVAAILGADSMLGRAIAGQLGEQGVAVLRIGRAQHNDIVCDLDVPLAHSLCAGRKADVVFHCASAFAGDDCQGLRTNLLTNSTGSANVLELMDRLECRNCVYAGSVSSINDADSAPYSSYGLSKAQAEQILAWGLARRSGAFCSFRLSQLYDSEGLCCVHQPWFGRIIAYASRGLELRLPPSEGGRNFVHVSDAGRLMIRAANLGLSGCWPLCHTEQLDSTQIAELAYQEFDAGGRIIVDNAKAPFRFFRFPDDRSLFSLLQDQPRIKMADGISMIHRSGNAGNFGPLDVE